MFDLTPPTSCQGYRVLQRLAGGARGSTWRAVDERSGAPVVIETHGPSMRLRQSLRLGPGLDGGLCPVLATWTDGDRTVVVRPWVAGVSLAARSAAPDARAVVESLARTLAVAHGEGVIHRHVELRRVLLAPARRPVLLGFGRADDTRPSRGGVYRAPEQVLRRRGGCGPWTDVYALGALLYELLTAQPPFPARSPALSKLILLGVFERPRELVPHVSVELEAVCLRAMRAARAERYPSARALAEDLARVERGAPSHARTPARWRRFVRCVFRV